MDISKPLPSIASQKNLKGTRVILRLDCNVPLESGKIRDTYRIIKSLPTINFLRTEGARIIILSHIGKGQQEDTLRPVADFLNTLFPVTFLGQIDNPENERLSRGMEDGDVIMIENLRHNPGEELNDPDFARQLARLGDIYVNDAFSVSHRAHASIAGVPALLPHFAGLQMEAEVARLSLAFNPEHPFLFVLGGAKISTKMPLLKKFLNIADYVFVGGATVNNLLKAKGYEIGKSTFDASELDGLEEVLASERLILPTDVIVKNNAGSEVRGVADVTSGDTIVDIGSETIRKLQTVIGSAKLIVWNGPLGFYEEGFTEGTQELLGLISGCRATSIIGGGDTVALMSAMGTLEHFSFVSTGGGAMLEYLATETLPGIEALA